MYPRYELEVPGGHSFDYVEKLMNENREASAALRGPPNRLGWWGEETHMRNFSLKHPGILFVLTVYDDGCDIKRKYFKDGKMEVSKAIISFPECKT